VKEALFNMSEEILQHPLLSTVLATNSYVPWELPNNNNGHNSFTCNNNSITQMLIRQTAVNMMHREELEAMSRARDLYIDELSQLLRLKDNPDTISPLLVPSPNTPISVETPNGKGSKRNVDTRQISQVKKQLQSTYQPEALEQAKQRKKRKGYSKEVSEILNSWYNDHITSPYPNEEEKRDLCNACGLTLLQLNNWFSNKRIREKKRKGGGSAQRSNNGSNVSDSNHHNVDHNVHHNHHHHHHHHPGMDLPLYASFSGQEYVFTQPVGRHPHEYAHLHGHEDITDYFNIK